MKTKTCIEGKMSSYTLYNFSSGYTKRGEGVSSFGIYILLNRNYFC